MFLGKISVLIGLISIFATGCAAAQPSPQAQGDAPVVKQYGGVLQGASNSEPTGVYWFDGVSGTSGLRTSVTPAVENLVTYQFTKQGDDVRSRGLAGHLGPALAESWAQVDANTYTFTLRKGVKWHDGEPFTAKDVRWSIERWSEPYVGVKLKAIARNIESVENPAPDVIQIRIKEPDGTFLPYLADFEPKILPAHPAEKGGLTGDALKDFYNKNLVGTGPFKFRSFSRTKSFELERFDGHWSGKPYLDGIRMLYGLERATQNAAFIAGELDFTNINDKVQFDQVERAAPGTQKVSYMIQQNPGLFMNILRPPLNDIRVRKAIHLAMDRQEMVNVMTFGDGAPSPPAPVIVGLSMAGVGMKPDDYLKLPGWRQPKEQDIAEAKRLLAEAGHASGLKLPLKYATAGGTPYLLAVPVAAALKNIGIEVPLIPQDNAIFNSEVIRDKDFDLNATISGGGPETVGDAAAVWGSGAAGNLSGVKDPDLDRLFLQARGESDQKKLNELIVKMQQIMIEKVYFIPLFTPVTFQALQPWVRDYYGSFSSSSSIQNSQATNFDVDKMPAARRKF